MGGAVPVIGVVNVNRELVYWKLYAVSLSNGVNVPISSNNLLMSEYPDSSVDVVTESSGSVTVAPGNSGSGNVSVSFVLNDVRSIVLEGSLICKIPLYLSLSQVDATYSGSAELVDVTVSLEIVSISTGSVSAVVSETKNVGKVISGTSVSSDSWSEIVFVNVPRTAFGGDNLVRLTVECNFSGSADASATVSTVVEAKIVYDGSMEFMLPVV